MRINGQKLATMKAAMTAVLEYFGKAAVASRIANSDRTIIAWNAWNIASDHLRYNDTHPAILRRLRELVPQDPTFDAYSNGDNDSHIQTAILKILRDNGF